MKSDVYKRKVGTSDDLLARILDAPTRKNKREDQFRQQHAIFAHELQIETEVYSVIFKNLM